MEDAYVGCRWPPSRGIVRLRVERAFSVFVWRRGAGATDAKNKFTPSRRARIQGAPLSSPRDRVPGLNRLNFRLKRRPEWRFF
eukprot:scaffold969_cov106-Isochrysis_galbana.AAC.4